MTERDGAHAAATSFASASGVRIVLKHPAYKMATFTKALGLEPSRAWESTDPVATLSGVHVGGTYGYGMWTCDTRNGDTLIENIEWALARLEAAKTVLREFISSGGTASIYVDLAGDVNSGAVLTPPIVRRLGALDVQFGFEVFP